jgi:multidrug efflux pump subunit AcrB
MVERYAGTLRWTLARRGLTVALSFAALVLITVLFGLFNPGVVFFPDIQPNLANVNITAPPGTALEVTDGIARKLEARFGKIGGAADIEFLVTSVGTSDDPFDFGGQGTPNKGGVAVNFHQKANRRQSSFTTLEEVRAATRGIAGADIVVAKQAMGPPVGAPVSIEIAGDDYQQLARLSEQVQERIRAIPGVVDLKDNYDAGKPEVEVVVDREKAATFGMSTGQIASTVRAAVNGAEASKYRLGEDEYKIRVRLRKEQRVSPGDLEQLYMTFMNKQGRLLSIPLVTVAEIRKTSSISSIQRKDQKRVITVSADVQGRPAGTVLQEVKESLASFPLPGGYTVRYSGQDEEQAKAQAFLGQAMIITLLLVFLILVMEFNSVKVPLVIMLSVPLSLVGVFLGVLVTGTTFSVIMTGVGVVALAGIVVRNAIVLLDFTKHLRERGMPLKESLIEAGRTRLRPVLLTAAATVLGIVPLATGVDFDWRAFHFVVGAESADFWRPLGVAIISGLTVSTFLTLVIVPTFYSLLEEGMEHARVRLRSLFGAAPDAAAAGTEA